MALAVGGCQFCTVASNLTAESNFKGKSFSNLSDLRGATVAVKRHSTAEEVARKNGALVMRVDSALEAIDLVESKKVNASLIDAPVADTRFKEGATIVLSDRKVRQDYGIMIRIGDERKPTINSAILTIIEDGTYDEIYNRWF